MLSPSAGIEYQVRLGWSGAFGTSLSLPGPGLAFWDPATASGDVYTAPVNTTEAAWPLLISLGMFSTLQVDQSISVPVTLTNLSAATPAQGLFTMTVTTVDGMPLWSGTRLVNVTEGGFQALPIIVPPLMDIGYVEVTGEISLGPTRRTVFDEAVEIHGFRAYLPAMLH